MVTERDIAAVCCICGEPRSAHDLKVIGTDGIELENLCPGQIEDTDTFEDSDQE